MDDTSPTLLLTRPKAQSDAFLAACEALAGQRLPVVISPLMAIEPVGDLPDLRGIDVIFVTSGHAVRRLGDAGFLRGRKVATVGEATAELARQFGADADCLGPDVETTIGRIGELSGCVLYARGRHVSTPVLSALEEKGLRASEQVVYDQIAQPLSTAARQLLAPGGKVVAPVFSKRSAELLVTATEPNYPSHFVAISNSVVTLLPGDSQVEIANAPTAEAMCRAVVGQFLPT